MQSHLIFQTMLPSQCCKQKFWLIFSFIKIFILWNFSFTEWIFLKNEETDNCKRDIPELFLLIEQIMHIIILKEKNETNAMQGIIPYGMIPCRTFVSLFFFNSTSDVVPIILYIAKMISYSNTHVKSENQNTKRTMETKSILYFCFWIKWCWRANSMKMTSSMSKDSSSLSKSCFSCYYHCSIVNFKNLIILFWNVWVMHGLWRS